jgi:hypothetical protein
MATRSKRLKLSAFDSPLLAAGCACYADDAVGQDVACIGCKELEGRWCRIYWPEEDEW